MISYEYPLPFIYQLWDKVLGILLFVLHLVSYIQAATHQISPLPSDPVMGLICRNVLFQFYYERDARLDKIFVSGGQQIVEHLQQNS